MNRSLTYDEARALLEEYARVVRSRNDRIRQAYEAHMSKTDISRHMEVDRGVVIRVLGSDSEEG